MGTIANQMIELATSIPEFDEQTKHMVCGMCYKSMDKSVYFSSLQVEGLQKQHIILTVAAF